MLYVAGKGAPGGGIEVALPPFELVPLTPSACGGCSTMPASAGASSW